MSQQHMDRRIILAFYRDEMAAQRVLDDLNEQDFPLDRVSVLGKASSSGDDPLGIYYPSAGERAKGWGRLGALWGGLLGLLGGAAGMFVLPGIGPLMAAGPIAESLVGAAGGSAIGGAVMAGGGAMSELGVAIHRAGVPEEQLEEAEELIGDGRHLVMLILNEQEFNEWRELLQRHDPNPLWHFVYPGFADAVESYAREIAQEK